jgi:protein-tyrosine phosphatase
MENQRSILATACGATLLMAHAAATAEVSNASVERLSATRVAVTWTSQSPVDVYLLQRPDASHEGGQLVADDNRTGRIEVDVAALQRHYFLLRDTNDGDASFAGERILPLEQGSNFRDLGGYATADGKHVKWGRLYRSGATPMLSAQDLLQIEALELTDLVDLRSTEERALAPTRIDGVKYTAVGYSFMNGQAGGTETADSPRMDKGYKRMPMRRARQFKVLFETLLEDDSTVAFNCSAGQDRTGVASALVLTALGVPRESIVADYHLSTMYRKPAYEMRKIDPALAPDNSAEKFFAEFLKDPAASVPKPLYDSNQKSLILYALEELEAQYGSVEGYLKAELGIGPAEIARLRAEFLE